MNTKKVDWSEVGPELLEAVKLLLQTSNTSKTIDKRIMKLIAKAEAISRASGEK